LDPNRHEIEPQRYNKNARDPISDKEIKFKALCNNLQKYPVGYKYFTPDRFSCENRFLVGPAIENSQDWKSSISKHTAINQEHFWEQ
jgi:hypothetical protein